MDIIETQTVTGVPVEVVVIKSAETLREVRASEWSDGQVQLLTFPSADPVAYVGTTPPLALMGRVAAVGLVLVKGPAGDIEVWTAAQFHERLVAA